jgi:DNA-directed RNA polymerase
MDDLVWPAIREKNHPGFQGPDGQVNAWRAALWLGPILWESIKEVVVAATGAMEWLQETALLLSKLKTPIYWTTPLGFPVRQDYYKDKRKRIETTLCGKRFVAILQERTNELDRQWQKRGIAPNFVHSMDATHMFATVFSAASVGVDAFAMVHDSYATHAADASTLAEHLRRNFVGLYTSFDVLQEFHDAAAERLSGHPELLEQLRPVPPRGGLDLTGVVRSLYFFA